MNSHVVLLIPWVTSGRVVGVDTHDVVLELINVSASHLHDEQAFEELDILKAQRVGGDGLREDPLQGSGIRHVLSIAEEFLS